MNVSLLPRAALYSARLLIGAAVLAPFWFWNGGLIEIEALQFIRQYLDGRSLLRKIFDPHANDFGTYQARELSYFLDYADARIFERLMANDLAVFVPATALIASLLTVIVFFWAMRRHRTLSPLTATLLLLLYLSNYTHLVTMGMFYRSTKPMLAPVLMATAFYVATLLERDSQNGGGTHPRSGIRPVGGVFLLFCLMSLLDRQGFFYALVGFALLAVNAVIGRRGREVAMAGGAAVALMVVYNLVLAPLIVERVSGYTPDFTYQQVPLSALLTGPRHYWQAAHLLLQDMAVLIGSMPGWLCAGLLAVLLTSMVRHSSTNVKIVWVVSFLAVAQIVMFAAMVVRHPPVYEWIDHRLWYYPLPFQALLVAVFAMVLNRLVLGWSAARVALLNVLLAAAVVSNVAHWKDYRGQMLQSRWFPTVYYQTDTLKISLKAGHPQPYLNEEYFGFYQVCLTISPALRHRATSGVGAQD